MSPVKYDTHKQGHWKARVLVRDKQNYKSNIINVDIKAVAGEKLRMDFNSTLMGPVAALTLNDNKMKLLVIEEKAFYSGNANSEALKKLIKMPLEPQLLYNMLFDKPVAQSGWQCENDKQNYVKTCTNKTMNLDIRWANRQVKKKTVIVDHPSASVQLNVMDFNRKFEDKGGEIFDLKAPDSYKRISL